MNKTDYKDMWVFIERDGDSVLPVSLELCSETRRLCDASGEKLVAVIVGSISDGELQRVLDCGVDKIIHVTGTGYDYFNNDAYTNLFTVLCRKYRPTAVMVGGTINGRDFAPRFAARLGTGCTSDATELVWDPKTTDIEFVEPAVGGKMMAVITVPVARPQVGTIRPGTFKCVPCGARAHEVIEEHIDFPVADIRTEILDFRADDLDESLNIADADVIVCVGNAIKGADALPRYRRLAERLGGQACLHAPGVRPRRAAVQARHRAVRRRGQAEAATVVRCVGRGQPRHGLLGCRRGRRREHRPRGGDLQLLHLRHRRRHGRGLRGHGSQSSAREPERTCKKAPERVLFCILGRCR